MKHLKIKSLILLLVFLIVFSSHTKAQVVNDAPPIKVNTCVVNIPVIANNKGRRYISGLKKEKFSIIQNLDLSADKETPVNIAILIDTSGNTFTFIENIIAAGQDFIKVLRPHDKALIATFDVQLHILTDLISDKEKLSWALNKTDVDGGSAANLPDAMYHIVTKEFAFTTGRKIIILLTDGNVTSRSVTNEKLLNILNETGTRVYPIIIKKAKLTLPNSLSPIAESKRQIDELNKQIEFITSLGITTGGKVYLNGTRDFKKPFQSIAEELKIKN